MVFFKKKGENANAGNKNGTAKMDKKMRATTMQELFKFKGISPDGILDEGDAFSKMYRLIDSNFVTEPYDFQADTLVKYSNLVCRFDDNVDYSIVIVNKKTSASELQKNFYLKQKGNNTDKFVEAYNSIIDAKMSEGNNNIVKVKYLLMTAHCKNLDDARRSFATIDVTLQEGAKEINKVGVVPLKAAERLTVMKEILNGSGCIPIIREYANCFEETDEGYEINLNAVHRSGKTSKDMIMPQRYVRENDRICLGENRWVRSFAYSTYPQELDTVFLTNTTNMPYEMVTTVHLLPVPRKDAKSKVNNMNNSIKADVIKAEQTAYRNQYDPDLINEDLIFTREEAKKIREDVVQGGKKLFNVTITISLIGDTSEELDFIASQFKAKCSDFGVTPQYLIGQQREALNSAITIGNLDIKNMKYMMTSDSSAAFFPFNIQELQDKGGHLYGINAVSKNMLAYNRKHSKLANGLIFGMSGSGKSVTAKMEMAANLMDGNDDMIILDPENEYRVLAEEFGGLVIDFEPKAELYVNPCDMNMEWDDPKATPLIVKKDYMVSLCESIMEKSANAFEVNVIHRATQRMYQPYIDAMTERHENGDDVDIDTEICPTLADFHEELLNDGSPEGTKVANAIEAYCIGSYNLFAHRTNINTDNRMVVYNLLFLPDKMKDFAMKVCLSSIWSKILKNSITNKKNGTNKAIWCYLDEFHLFFQTQSSATTIMQYYKRVRKYGGIMTGITQDVADLLRNQQGTSMFNNTGFFIFMNQSPIGRDQLQTLYNLSNAMIDYIKDRPSGTGLIYNGTVWVPFDFRIPKNNALFDLVTTDPNDRVAKNNNK